MNEDIIISDITAVRLDVRHINSSFICPTPREHSSIVYTLEGKGRYTAEGVSYQHRRGDISVVTEGKSDVSEYLTEPVRYIFFDFHTVKPLVCSPAGLPYVTTPGQPETYRVLFEKALSIWNSRPFYYQTQCRELLYAIINRVVI